MPRNCSSSAGRRASRGPGGGNTGPDGTLGRANVIGAGNSVVASWAWMKERRTGGAGTTPYCSVRTGCWMWTTCCLHLSEWWSGTSDGCSAPRTSSATGFDP